LESADVSVEALDSLLLSESVSIENEDGLLWFILKLSPGCRDLLKHIAIIFLSANGLSLLGTDFRIPPESLWQCAFKQFAGLLLDSRIISGFPKVFVDGCEI
jgi:hypothetical protein